MREGVQVDAYPIIGTDAVPVGNGRPYPVRIAIEAAEGEVEVFPVVSLVGFGLLRHILAEIGLPGLESRNRRRLDPDFIVKDTIDNRGRLGPDRSKRLEGVGGKSGGREQPCQQDPPHTTHLHF